jgi:hypothetical protein
MNCTRLKQTWKPIYDGFERGADALFNRADARLKARHNRCRNCRCRRALSAIGIETSKSMASRSLRGSEAEGRLS